MEVEPTHGGPKRLLERANSELSVGSFIFLALPVDVLSLVMLKLKIGETLLFAMTSKVIQCANCTDSRPRSR